MRCNIIFSLLLVVIGSSVVGNEVVIYSDANSAFYGVSIEKRGKIKIGFDKFLHSETLPAGSGEGVLTAVVLDYKVVQVLYDLLNTSGSVQIENTIISREIKNSMIIYRYSDHLMGLSFSFSLEKAGNEIFNVIDSVYKDNIYWANEVKTHYEENYVIRIHEAEDILDHELDVITYNEALLNAEILGDKDQWLWGIHDGSGFLDNLSLAVLKMENQLHKGYNHYRDYTENDQKMYNFIKRIEKMPGNFVQNLHELTGSMFRFENNNNLLVFPEKFIDSRRGGLMEYTAFYYDILKRMGYEVIIAILRNPDNRVEIDSVVFFRSINTSMWGIISKEMLIFEQDYDYQKIPAYLYNRNTEYFIVDENFFFNTGDPGTVDAEWKLSIRSSRS